MPCPICGNQDGGSAGSYPNVVCDECDEKAVTESGEDPWHGWPSHKEPESQDGVIQDPPDQGGNPVFINGQKCWRRYRFGGWITMMDEYDCNSLKEFYEKHGVM